MTDEPIYKPGDRVRVVVEGTVDGPIMPIGRGRLCWDDGGHIAMARALSVEVVKAAPIPEFYQDDLVRNADDESDLRLWSYDPRINSKRPWLVAGTGNRLAREEMPEHVRVVARHGRLVPAESTVAA